VKRDLELSTDLQLDSLNRFTQFLGTIKQHRDLHKLSNVREFGAGAGAGAGVRTLLFYTV
jgi:hypothetical protein